MPKDITGHYMGDNVRMRTPEQVKMINETMHMETMQDNAAAGFAGITENMHGKSSMMNLPEHPRKGMM